MKVFIVFAAICFLAVAMAQEEDEDVHEAAIREARMARAPVMCAGKCQYDSCKKICLHCAICFCSNRVYGVCKCCD